MGVIYKIVNPKGRVYVGQTYNLKHRVASHKCASKNGGSAVILHNSIKKYGWENHFLEVIEEVPDELLNEREMFWIATLKTNRCDGNPMGLNMSVGGGGNRHKWGHNKERVEKARERFSGDKNPFKGRKHTAEAKAQAGAKISKINRDKGQTVPKWGAEKSYAQSRRGIVVYDMDGNFIREFISISETAKHFGISTGDINSVLRGKQTHANQKVFKYTTPNYPLIIDVSDIEFKRMNAPILLLNHNLQVMRVYPSAKEAENELNSPARNIGRRAFEFNGKPRKSGYTFVYQDEYEKISNQLN